MLHHNTDFLHQLNERWLSERCKTHTDDTEWDFQKLRESAPFGGECFIFFSLTVAPRWYCRGSGVGRAAHVPPRKLSHFYPFRELVLNGLKCGVEIR